MTADIAEIISSEALRIVFQPIYRVRDGAVFGYEALTRGPEGLWSSPLELFAAAERAGLEAQLDTVCRRMAVTRFKSLTLPGFLFMNVSPQVIVSMLEVRDRVLAWMRRMQMDPASVVVEISEGKPFDEIDAVMEAIQSFRQVGFRFALDDLGAGYAGLRVWSQLRPAFVKVDRHFVADCDQDPAKREFLRSIKGISNYLGCEVVAEGIEREQEASIIQALGIDYAQGFGLARPETTPALDATTAFKTTSRTGYGTGLNFTESLERLVQTSSIVAPTDTADSVLDRIRQWEALPDIPVVDNGRAVGSVNRVKLLDRFAGRYTRELHGRQPIVEFLDNLAPLLEIEASIEEASRRLSAKSPDVLPSCVIVTRGNEYQGVVPASALMRQLSEAQLRAARYSNPLTLLPGNVPIVERIQDLLDRQCKFGVAYCDLNNFKPFNDVYGYALGDEVLQLVAELLVEHVSPAHDFIGHIGGDDFVVVSEADDFDQTVRCMAGAFAERVKRLYRPEHLAMGGILAVDRSGVETTFPLMRLSVGVVRPDPVECGSHHDVASMASDAKHQAKLNAPDYLFFCRRRSPSALVEVGEGVPPEEEHLQLYKI